MHFTAVFKKTVKHTGPFIGNLAIYFIIESSQDDVWFRLIAIKALRRFCERFTN